MTARMAAHPGGWEDAETGPRIVADERLVEGWIEDGRLDWLDLFLALWGVVGCWNNGEGERRVWRRKWRRLYHSIMLKTEECDEKKNRRWRFSSPQGPVMIKARRVSALLVADHRAGSVRVYCGYWRDTMRMGRMMAEMARMAVRSTMTTLPFRLSSMLYVDPGVDVVQSITLTT